MLKTVTAVLLAGGISADGAVAMFSTIIDLMAKGLVAFGAILCVIGVVGLAQGLREHAGSQMNSGITSLVAGGLIILASAILKTITLA